MKLNFTFFKNSLLILIPLCFATSMTAQVGIGTDTPNPNAVLDVSADQKPGGLLIPRIALTAANSNQIGKIKGMIVYNTQDAGSGNNEVTEGYYYHNGTRWIRMIDQRGDYWSTKGNNINGSTHFLGTTGNQPLVVKVNNQERMRIRNDGKILVNKENPGSSLNSIFSVASTGNLSAIMGEAEQGNGIHGIVGQGRGVYGLAEHRNGIGVYAENSDEDGVALIAHSGTLSIFSEIPSGTGAAFVGSGIGGIAYGRDLLSGIGLVGLGDGETDIPNNTSGSGVVGSGTTGVYGRGSTGVVGVGNNRSGVDIPGQRAGVVGNGDKYGVYGRAYNSTESAGGYFINTDNVIAKVATHQNGTDYKILGEGVVATLVRGVNGQELIMSAPETPEFLFQDYGEGNLVNGEAEIRLDPNFAVNINVSPNHPLRVFVQLEEGDCSGVFVTDKTAEGFRVKEIQNGSCNGSFSWEVVATRANTERVDENGKVHKSDYSKRFPPLPASFRNPQLQASEKAPSNAPASQVQEQINK